MLEKELLQFNKGNEGLLPAVIQDNLTLQVLMLGYMNREALDCTLITGNVTFYSRSKKRLWVKGEKSGNYLKLVSVEQDCDKDTLLIKVNPIGPTCHKETKTCWGEGETTEFGVLSTLEEIIDNRLSFDTAESYISSLKSKGISKIAQKVGEEAVELVIEAMKSDDQLFKEESADLLFHFLILLKSKGTNLQEVLDVLKKRRK